MQPEWHFPPTNGGQEDGYNHVGIAHFSGRPLSSLAREVIQNSLDAQLDPNRPVEVDFDLKKLSPLQLGVDKLLMTIWQCRERAEADHDWDACEALDASTAILGQSTIDCLRVYDRNTTGLRSENWKALVKVQGLSQKRDPGAGGSHGIGKFAPFVVSALRSVFYWTCYESDGHLEERFQGKALLLSHGPESDRKQGIGFFGDPNQCREITSDIPRHFRVLEGANRPLRGTAILIAGFSGERGWQTRVAASIVENYFVGIASGKLKIHIDQDPDSNLPLEIEEGNLQFWFDYLTESSELEGADLEEIGTDLARAKAYWSLLGDDIEHRDCQDTDLGHCRLYITVAKGLPSKVAWVRRTGMLITDYQEGLRQFPLHQPFAAMIVIEDPSGNELLKSMENPQHDAFEPDRIRDAEEQARARRALKRIMTWIREQVREVAGPTEGTGHPTLRSLPAICQTCNRTKRLIRTSRHTAATMERSCLVAA